MKKIFFGKRGFEFYLIFALALYVIIIIKQGPWMLADVPVIGWPAALFLHYLILLFVLFLYWLFIRFVIISPILWIAEHINKK